MTNTMTGESSKCIFGLRLTFGNYYEDFYFSYFLKEMFRTTLRNMTLTLLTSSSKQKLETRFQKYKEKKLNCYFNHCRLLDSSRFLTNHPSLSLLLTCGVHQAYLSCLLVVFTKFISLAYLWCSPSLFLLLTCGVHQAYFSCLLVVFTKFISPHKYMTFLTLLNHR